MANPNDLELVTRKALVRRINNALAAKGHVLKAKRNGPNKGSYFVMDTHNDRIVNRRPDLVKLGRELGVMEVWERMEE